MNKLKLAYDVVKTLQDKEAIQGSLQVQGRNDQLEIFSFGNEFTRNLQTGATKARIKTQVDCEGHSVKHESCTEFTLPAGHNHLHHLHHHSHGHCQHPSDCNPGIKAKLNRLACALSILNQITLTEQTDRSVLLALNTNDLPEEIKQSFHEKLQRHGFRQAWDHVTVSSLELSVLINPKREVEQVVFTVDGQGDSPEKTTLSLTGELSLTW